MPNPSQQQPQQPVERPVKTAVAGIALAGLDPQHEIAEQRGLRQREHPAEQQRQGQHDEKRLDDFGDGRRSEVEGQEREDGNQGSPQQTPAGSDGGVDHGAAALDTPKHRLLGVVGDDDGVVDQHAHGDDEPSQRSTVEPLAEKLHQKQRSADRKEQRTADQHPGAEPHDEHDDGDDDGDRFGQIDKKRRIGLTGDAVLGIENGELHAHGHPGRLGVEDAADAVAGLHDIGLRIGRNADADGPAAVDAHESLRRLGVAPLHARDVAQPILLARRRNQELVGDVVETAVGTLLDDADFERAGLLLAAADHGVLLADGGDDGLGPDGEIGQRRQSDIDVDDGLLLAEQSDFLHAVDGDEQGFEPLRLLAQLAPREPLVDREGVIDAVDIAEIVGHGDAPAGRRGWTLSTLRRSSSQSWGISRAEVAGSSSTRIFESP